MRVLLLTETVPWPLDSGGRVKTWHTLNVLASEHEVHCHAFVREASQGDAATERLRQACASVSLHLLSRNPTWETWYLARSLATGVPFTVIRHFSSRALRAVARDCRERRIDFVYCDHLSMFEYCRRLDVAIVHDAHNVEHRIMERHVETLAPGDPRRVLLSRESRSLRRYEAAMYRRARLVFAVSEVDAAEIAALAGGRVPVVPVPIAVDASKVGALEPIAESPQILFVGTLAWPPNAGAVNYWLEAIWPRVKARRPDATCVVVGRGESGLARRWERTAGVRFTGWVADVEPWFRSSRVMVVPVRAGSGMRVKILDAFVRGVPVVTTQIGIEGIEAQHGVHALIADEPGAFASEVIRLLDDRRLAEALRAAARRLVVDRYDVAVVGRAQLEALRETFSGGLAVAPSAQPRRRSRWRSGALA